ncbi:MAG: hypothetical protein Kow006_20830 [Gammaproteobacteria bacterium]
MASSSHSHTRIAWFLLVFVYLGFDHFQSANAAVGTLPGKFSVSATGAANYEIPLEFAPGIAGMQPELSLAYNNRSGNGTLGVGWSLTGLSAIHRCSSNLAQDGIYRGIDFSSNDRFCLDGQRLILVSGTYGAPDAEYRTELDIFAKIVSEGTAGSGPDLFRVWTKSGRIMEFGGTADSRIEAQGRIDVMVWAVNRVSDRKGNYMTFSYDEDNANGEYRIDAIHYTGNPTLSPAASVTFEYETRPDVKPVYVGGTKTQQSQRLLAIHAFVGTTEFKTYHFTYETAGQGSNVRSFLDSVQECADATECLPATYLTWHHPANSAQFSGAISTSYSGYLADFNGDGRDDRLRIYMPVMTNGFSFEVALSNGSGFGANQRVLQS